MVRRFLFLFLSIAFAACGTSRLADEEPENLPDRTEGGATSDARTTADAPDDAPTPYVDSGVWTCGSKDGLNVVCIRPGATFTTSGTLTYGPGFSGPLPAMGFGKRQLGYLPSNDPFTCVATPGLYAVSANNTAGGKICEVSFDNTRSGQTTGTATYAVTAYADAGAGDFDVGLTATSGTTILESAFFFRVVPP